MCSNVDEEHGKEINPTALIDTSIWQKLVKKEIWLEGYYLILSIYTDHFNPKITRDSKRLRSGFPKYLSHGWSFSHKILANFTLRVDTLKTFWNL